MKKAVTLILVIVLIFALSTTAFAGGRGHGRGGNGGHRSQRITAICRRDASDNLRGQRNLRCVEYGHICRNTPQGSRAQRNALCENFVQFRSN